MWVHLVFRIVNLGKNTPFVSCSVLLCQCIRTITVGIYIIICDYCITFIFFLIASIFKLTVIYIRQILLNMCLQQLDMDAFQE